MLQAVKYSRLLNSICDLYFGKFVFFYFNKDSSITLKQKVIIQGEIFTTIHIIHEKYPCVTK
jgi:hypothetical protein